MPKIFLANQTDLITTTATAVAALPVAAANTAGGYAALDANKDIPRDNLPPIITNFVAATPVAQDQIVNNGGNIYVAKVPLTAGDVVTSAVLDDPLKFTQVVGSTASPAMGGSTVTVGGTKGAVPASPINSMNKVLHASGVWATPEAKVIPFVLARQYELGAVVDFQGSQYIANANIPANTTFVIGVTGATWRVISNDLRMISLVNQPASFNLSMQDKNYLVLNQTTSALTCTIDPPSNPTLNSAITAVNKGTAAISIIGYTGADPVILAPKTSTSFTWNAADLKYYPASGGSGLTVLAQTNMTADGNITPLTNNYITFAQTTSSIKATLLAPPTTTAPTIITAANIGTTEITILSKAGGVSIKLAPKTTMDLSWGVAAAEWLPTGGGSGGGTTLANTWYGRGFSSVAGTTSHKAPFSGFVSASIKSTGNLSSTSLPRLLAGRTYLLTAATWGQSNGAVSYFNATFCDNATNAHLVEAVYSATAERTGNYPSSATHSAVLTPASDLDLTILFPTMNAVGGVYYHLTVVEVFSNNVTVNGVQAEYGEVTVPQGGANLTIGGSGWQSADASSKFSGSITLPSAGVWEVDYYINITTATNNQVTSVQLRYSEGSPVIGSASNYNSNIENTQQLLASSTRITTTGPVTLQLWVMGYAGNIIYFGSDHTAAALRSTSRVQWKKISGFLPVSASGVMVGATSSTAGSSGVVPAPVAGEQAEFLRGNGTWAYVGGDVVHAAFHLTNYNFSPAGTVTLPFAGMSSTSLGINVSGNSLVFQNAGRYRVEFRGAVCHATTTQANNQVKIAPVLTGMTLEAGTYFNLTSTINSSSPNTTNSDIVNLSNMPMTLAVPFCNIHYFTATAGGSFLFQYFTLLASTAASATYGASMSVSITRIG